MYSLWPLLLKLFLNANLKKKRIIIKLDVGLSCFVFVQNENDIICTYRNIVLDYRVESADSGYIYDHLVLVVGPTCRGRHPVGRPEP